MPAEAEHSAGTRLGPRGVGATRMRSAPEGRHARRGLILALLTVGLGLSLPAPPARAQPKIQYDIPPQPLPRAMEAYALATGVQVLYDRPTGAEPPSPGVKGILSAQDALDRLLAGTGLTSRFVDGRNVVLQPAGAGPVQGASDGAPPDLPTLAPGAVHVDVPLVVQGPASTGLAARRYGEVIKSSVADALALDAKTSRARYRAGLSIWIASSGAILKATVVRSSGREELDMAICTVLERVIVDETPPPDLPQPVNILVASRISG